MMTLTCDSWSFLLLPAELLLQTEFCKLVELAEFVGLQSVLHPHVRAQEEEI